MKAGADGVISVASNVAPAEMVQFVHAALKGQAGLPEAWQEAEALEARLGELFRNLFIEPNPIPGKAAMARLGLMENSLRLPLVPATEATETLMQHTLDALFKK